MRLEKLTLANFRGFEQIHLDFAENITVIAGVNGVGKSGVLKALTNAMALALPRFTPSKEPSLGLSDTDIQNGKSGLSMSVALKLDAAHVLVDLTRAVASSATEAEKLTKRRDELRFATRETKKGSKDEQKVVDEIRHIEIQLDQATDISSVRILPDDPAIDTSEFVETFKSKGKQPLAVFYSTTRFLSRLPPSLGKTKILSIASAYEKSLNQLEVSLYDFVNWYRAVKAEAAAEARDRMLQQLDQAIAAFLPEVSCLTLHEERPPRVSVSKGGKTFYLEQLSDGERGLLALVFDLTRRLALANPESADPIAEGVALVLIDEIEMHLHPKWQRDVLQRLQSTFPSCQFVVTTHSPLVLGEVPARCVRFLDYSEGKVRATTPAEAFGMDANRILQEFMGASVRNRQVDGELRALFDLIDQEKFDEARVAISGLARKLGADEPELTRATSLIRFLEGTE